MKIGRNDPCPCGSGKKYKKCCAGKQETGQAQAELGAVMEEVKVLIKDQTFASLEEANAFISQHMRQRNQAASADFQGLSPEQMHRFLYFPFDSPQLVTFPSVLAAPPDAPIVTLFKLLMDAIGEDGLKPTVKGNLPRNFCRDAAVSFLGEEKYRQKTRFGNINSETDFYDLHATRLVAELAGLIRKYRGKFILSRECRKLLTDHGLAGVYPRLLQAFAKDFNWGYRDRYPDFHMIQGSFLFTMYLLHRYGDQWRPHTFYGDCFLRAFPMILREVESVSYDTPENIARSCYYWRCLEGFAAFLGLVEIEWESEKILDRRFRLKKSSLLEEAVVFHGEL